jgi:hypothetical protein
VDHVDVDDAPKIKTFQPLAIAMETGPFIDDLLIENGDLFSYVKNAKE